LNFNPCFRHLGRDFADIWPKIRPTWPLHLEITDNLPAKLAPALKKIAKPVSEATNFLNSATRSVFGHF